MNAYLFTALCTMSQVRKAGPIEAFQMWDNCSSLVVLGESAEAAQTRFEQWLEIQPDDEHPRQVDVRKIAAAQLVDQLITETGHTALDWAEIQKEVQAQVESMAVDDFEQGYWVDANPVVRPDHRSLSIEALKQDVPEDIRDGLNWSPDKNFLYLLTALAQPPPPPEFREARDDDTVQPAESAEEALEGSETAELDHLLSLFPQGADKDGAALIRARNSVVAAWLWRRFAANTPLAANSIRIDPWCGIMDSPTPSAPA